VSLGQAVRRVYAQLSPAERHRIGVRAEGDPLELGGRTHPTIAMRIAAVSKLPAVAPVALPAFDPARLEAFEAQLSRRWLQGVARPVPVEEFLGPAGSAQPVASRGHAEPAEVDAALAAAPAPEGPTLADEDAPLELDTGYDWRDRQGG
jgi:hypothetical protein